MKNPNTIKCNTSKQISLLSKGLHVSTFIRSLSGRLWNKTSICCVHGWDPNYVYKVRGYVAQYMTKTKVRGYVAQYMTKTKFGVMLRNIWPNQSSGLCCAIYDQNKVRGYVAQYMTKLCKHSWDPNHVRSKLKTCFKEGLMIPLQRSKHVAS